MINVNIIFIDDRATDNDASMLNAIKQIITKNPSLFNEQLGSKIKPHWFYYNFIDNVNYRDEFWEKLKSLKTKDIPKADYTFVFIDFELHRPCSGSRDLNNLRRNQAFNAFKNNENSFLYYYSAVDASQASTFLDNILNCIPRNEAPDFRKCYIYPEVLAIFFFRRPYNFPDYLLKLYRDIIRIVGGNFASWN